MDDARNHANLEESHYWRSLRELHQEGGIDEVKADELMAGATDEFDPSALSPMSRKRFLALLTASAAFAAAGCTDYRNRGEIVPYSRKPEEITPGVANYYASTCTGCSQYCGILIKTREGRPIKIDGNPDHPVSQGKICATGQATILDLYDPQRLRNPAYGNSSGRSGELTWDRADRDIRQRFDAAVRDGKEIALVTSPTMSPSARKTLSLFVERYPTTKIYMYQLFNDENRRRAWRQSYGGSALPAISWEQASIVLALESDFLGSEGNTVENIRRFTRRRDIMKGSDFNRLYCVEGAVTLTSANSDYRLRLRPDLQLEFVLCLINEIALARHSVSLDANVLPLLKGHSLEEFARRNDLSRPILNHLVDDLIGHKGKSIVYAGSTLPDGVHVAVNFLNEILENDSLYDAHAASTASVPHTSPEEFEALAQGMKAGNVAAVVHLQTNPVFHLPRAIGYGDSLKKVPLSVSLVQSDDETSQLCTYVLPVHHAFEAWGDFASRVGVISFQQPVIAPLYPTRQAEAALLYWSSNETTFRESMYHEFLMAFWEKEMFPSLHRNVDFKAFWNSALHDGAIQTDVPPSARGRCDVSALTGETGPGLRAGYVLALRPNYFIGDGRFAGNGWLQELPHPVSKIVWDNYAALSPKTASDLAVASGDMVRIELPHGSQTMPVFVQPGLADGFVSMELGYGRWNAGPVGTAAGTDANVLLPKTGLTGARVYRGATLTKTPEKHELASTQEHHALDDTFLKELHLKRRIIQEGTVAQFQKDPQFLHQEETQLSSISKGVTYSGVKWAMAIDLNKCVGCNACVSGCNVENNIPVVGKEQVQKGREMQWIRIDRYYAGMPDAPTLSHQPMLCQHCDNAPCENVCPVAATNHSPDGLNQMVYNRCVGTKYCSNNCPYKVRRFNFLNFRDNLADSYYLREPVNLVNNPEVTVRSRGVMEKCTFCIQRIAEARQHAAEQGRTLSGNDVKTACQEACPAEAIVFGDMNNQESKVSHYRKHPLGYHVLEEINVRPNVTYLARLRNIHPEKSA
jgi:Fe-S-cluster-containing dehydrogenase component/anaerobic selenocysteine-containing dehydrogenase